MISGESGTKHAIVLGVITCRNPKGLMKLLTEFWRHQATSGVRIVVVDNDFGEEGAKASRQFLRDHPNADLSIFVEHALGIPFARNRVVAEAMKEPFDYLLMLDDDEYPSEGWLTAMVETAQRAHADIVGGPVRGVLETEPLPPVLKQDYAKPGGRSGRAGVVVSSTANVLLSRRLLETFVGNWFDRRFRFTGGEDTEFLLRTKNRGFFHAVASQALVFEDISGARLSPEWHYQRWTRNGAVLARIRMIHGSRFAATALECLNIAGLLGKSVACLLIGAGSSRAKFQSMVCICRIKGKLMAIFDIEYDEYHPANYRPT